MLWIAAWALYTLSIAVNIYVQSFDQIDNELIRLLVEIVYDGAIGYILIAVMVGYYGYCEKSNTLKLIICYSPFLIYSLLAHIARVILLSVPIWDNWRKALFPLPYECYGRMTVLVLVAICGEYIHWLVDALEQKECLKLMGIMFAIWCVWPTFLGGDMYGLDVGVTLFAYVLGCYIAKYEELLPARQSWYVYGSIGLSLLVVLGTFGLEQATQYMRINVLALVNMTSPVLYLWAFCMMMAVRRKSVWGVANRVASLCMGAFAIYGHEVFSRSGKRLLLFFLIGIVVETIRNVVSHKMEQRLFGQ